MPVLSSLLDKLNHLAESAKTLSEALSSVPHTSGRDAERLFGDNGGHALARNRRHDAGALKPVQGAPLSDYHAAKLGQGVLRTSM